MLQKELEASIPGQKFLDTSLSDTLYKLMSLDDQGSKRAEKIRNEFKVPDKRLVICFFTVVSPANCLYRYWWIRIKALADIRDWEQMEKFSKVKKSPIGYEVRLLTLLRMLHTKSIILAICGCLY
jgi:vacuolar protein sorting-associated protein 16